MDGLSLMSTPDSCSRKTVHWGEVPHLFSSSLYSLSSWVSVLSGCPPNTPGQHLNIYPLCWRYESGQKDPRPKNSALGGPILGAIPSSPPPLDNRSHPVPSHLRSSIFSEISLASMDWNSAPPRTLTGKMGRWDVLTQTLLTVALRRSGSPCSSKYDHICVCVYIYIYVCMYVYIYIYVCMYIYIYIYDHTSIYHLYWIIQYYQTGFVFSNKPIYVLLMFTAFLGCFKMHQTQTLSIGCSFRCGRYVCHLRLLLASLSLRHPAATTCTSSINDHPPQTDLLTSPHLLTKNNCSFELEDTSKNIPQSFEELSDIFFSNAPECRPASSVDLPWDGSTHPRSRGS